MAAEHFSAGKELPSLLPKQGSLDDIRIKEGHYGPVFDTMRQGFSSVQNNLTPSHPLEYSEKNFCHVENKRDMMMLHSIQGLHAPLKLQIERSIVSQRTRLPCLPSSMIALETLLGTDITIDFEDFLNDPRDCEATKDTHSLMESQ